MNYFRPIRSELLKTKRTASFYLGVFTSALIPLLLLIDYATDTASLKALLADPWHLYYKESYAEFSMFLLPMFLILSGTLLPQIEYRNHTWRQVLCAPHEVLQVVLSKFIVLHTMILMFVLCYHLFMAATAVVLQLIQPETGFFSHALPLGEWAMSAFKTWLSVLAFSAAQFWMGMRFRNFIVPIGAGFCLWLAAVMLVMELHSPNAYLFPFAHPILHAVPDEKANVPELQWVAAGFTIFFLLLAFADIRRRRLMYS